MIESVTLAAVVALALTMAMCVVGRPWPPARRRWRIMGVLGYWLAWTWIARPAVADVLAWFDTAS